jgi:hypothetical protein
VAWGLTVGSSEHGNEHSFIQQWFYIHLLHPGLLFNFVILYTGDQPFAGPLSTHSIAQTRNKSKHPCLEWDSNPRSQRSSRREHCDRRNKPSVSIKDGEHFEWWATVIFSIHTLSPQSLTVTAFSVMINSNWPLGSSPHVQTSWCRQRDTTGQQFNSMETSSACIRMYVIRVSNGTPATQPEMYRS